MYNNQGMCCLCLKASVSLTDLFTTDQNGITVYDKIASSLTRIANVIEWNANFSVCEACSNTIDIVYDFNQTCLKSINSYKAMILQPILNQQQHNDSPNLEITESINIQSNGTVTVKVESALTPHFMDSTNVTNQSVTKNNSQVGEELIIKSERQSPLIEQDTNDNCEEGTKIMEYEEAGSSSQGIAASRPRYESDSELNNIELKQKKLRKHIMWEKVSVFQDESDVMNFLTTENCWSKLTKFNDCHGNMVIRYRCNKVKLRGQQCAAALRIVYNSTNNDIYLYRSTSSHNHSNISSKQPKISEEVRQEIQNIYNWDDTIKPARILQKLFEKKLPVPTKVQLTNYLAALRKQKQERSQEHLGDLQEIIIEKSVLPLGET